MVSSQTPNQDAIYHALNIFRPAMRRFIISRLSQASGNNLENIVKAALMSGQNEEFDRRMNRSGGDLEDALDIGDFPRLFEYYWDEIFSTLFSESREAIVAKLRHVANTRNRISHPGVSDIEPGYAVNSLENMVYLLRQIGDQRRLNK